MADSTWDDVGRSFTDLGRELQKAWETSRPDDATRSELKDAGDKVKVVLDDVAETINRAAGSTEVREAAKKAMDSVADAVSDTLRLVVDAIDNATKSRAGSEESTGAPRERVVVEDAVPEGFEPRTDDDAPG